MAYGVLVSAEKRPSTVRLEPEQERALAQIGERLDRSRSWLIRKAVAEFIERHQQATEGGAEQ